MTRSRSTTDAASPRWLALVGLVALTLAASLPAAAGAQQPTRQPTTRRRQAPIEIRGQVPTPQVVTVRPREVPQYDRRVLVPRFYDHDFWPEIAQGYQLLPERLVSGNASVDSVNLRVDSIGVPTLFTSPTVEMPKKLEPRTVTIKRQARWCAPMWWCPMQRQKVKQPLDSATIFNSLPRPDTTTAPPAKPQAMTVEPQPKWCTPRWWCGETPLVAVPVRSPADTARGRTAPPATTTPRDTTARPPTPTVPVDSTRRPPADTTRRVPPDTTRRVPADSTRRPPGTPPASDRQ